MWYFYHKIKKNNPDTKVSLDGRNFEAYVTGRFEIHYRLKTKKININKFSYNLLQIGE